MHSELGSDVLRDMVELALVGSVTWPPGLNERIAQSILESRAAKEARSLWTTPQRNAHAANASVRSSLRNLDAYASQR